jgi:biopolymer transport protein ExbB
MNPTRTLLFLMLLSICLSAGHAVLAQSGQEPAAGNAQGTGPSPETAQAPEPQDTEADAPADADAGGQDEATPKEDLEAQFAAAARAMRQKLEDANERLNALRREAEQIRRPLQQEASELEKKLRSVEQTHQETVRQADQLLQKVENLKSSAKSRREQVEHLRNLFGDYNRGFGDSLHPGEKHLWMPLQKQAAGALEKNRKGELSTKEFFSQQGEFLLESVDRLEELAGGARYPGKAVAPNSEEIQGSIVLLGPAGLFAADEGNLAGMLAPGEADDVPSVLPFNQPEDVQAARQLVRTGQGQFPLDSTLVNAYKIEQTEETIIEHIQKGGVVVYPIIGMAGLALLVVLFKWVSLVRIPKPNRKRVQALYQAVRNTDEAEAKRQVEKIKGPVGRMLRSGVDHLHEPYELIEEVMYETVLATRLKLQRLLPFVSIAAASAPLLGLLGTVTGIINTFKQMEVYGSGDVKMISGGISEALITTEFGLIVAIPSLLLHAFLSRKAKGMANDMEKTAISFVNQVRQSGFNNAAVEDLLEEKLTRDLHVAEEEEVKPAGKAQDERAEIEQLEGVEPEDSDEQSQSDNEATKE